MTNSLLLILLCIVLVGILLYFSLTWYLRGFYNKLLQFKDDLEQQLQTLEKVRADLEENQRRREALQEKRLQAAIDQALQVPKTASPAKKETTLETFFMPIPNGDGSFLVSAASENFKPTVSVYKFKEVAPGKAQFRFDSDAEGRRDALNFVSSYIQPVCEELNDVHPDATQITTVQPGIAERNGYKWMIVQKAKIRYE